jgi:hypothetical protein
MGRENGTQHEMKKKSIENIPIVFFKNREKQKI